MPTIVKSPPAPGTGEWLGQITASKVPAILGVSRFKSQFAMWHEMAGLTPPAPVDEDRMKWGHVAESSLASWWRYKNPAWKLNPRRGGTFELAYTNPELPFPNMATLDRRAYRPDVPRAERFRILELKTAGTLADWGRPGEEDSIPADYYTQVQFQMGVSGIHSADVVVLGGATRPEIHRVEFNEGEFARIVDRCVDWQASLEMGIAPELDGQESTYVAVRGKHPNIADGKEVQIDEATAVRLLDTVVGLDEAESAYNHARSEIGELMGEAKYLKCGDVKIADRRSKQGGTPYVQFNKNANLEGDNND